MEDHLRLGYIIGHAAERDAVHIAVAPVVAGERLAAGTPLKFLDASRERVVSCGGHWGDSVGVVDPFLRDDVRAGQRFWMFLYPGSIRSLRHEWTHPAFVDDSRAVIEAIAADLGITFGALMAAAHDWVNNGEYTTEYGTEQWRDNFPAHANTFWKHYEKITGLKIEDHTSSFFSCSC